MESRWFERSFRRNLVDMHINDADPAWMSQYDPVRYADNLVAAGVDTAILYAGNCLGICFWPTPWGHMHEGLHGRDILGEVIAQCRRRGLHVVVYFNIWSRWAYDTHPDWRCRDAQGRGQFVESDGQRYGVCCPSTGYADYVYAQINDLVSRYDMDGLWIDMIGWFGGVCHCPACQARALEETGAPLPERIDWRDEGWRRFQARREAWHAGFARGIREAALSLRPELSVVFQAASWSLGWRIGLSEELYRQSDYLAGDFYGDPAEQSFVCKYLNSLTENKPVEFMSSRCPTLSEHTTTKQQELLEAQAWASVANNACFVFIDAMDPAGTVNPAPYRTMGEIFSRTKRYEPFLGPQLQLRADVALYADIHSLARLADNGRALTEPLAGSPAPGLKQMAATLVRHNLPYDVVTRRDLHRLGDYQVLVLSDAFMLDAAEAEAIRAFVSAGGRLYASHDTSLVLGGGDFLLADVFGVSYQGETAEEETYMAPVSGYEGLAPFTRQHPMTVNSKQSMVHLRPGARALATVTLPWGPVNDAYDYSSAISNPPGRWTDFPALVENTYGRGVCVYAAGSLEWMPHDAHGVLFARILRSLMGREPVFVTNAPRPVELTVYEDPAAGRLLVCALNFQRELPAIPVHGLTVSVGLKSRACTGVSLLPDGAPLPYEVKGDRVILSIDRLDLFAMAAISYR